jgi:glycogen phosphorylase
MPVKQFLVLPRLPERIQPLQELAHNLWYCWNWEFVRLLIRLDADAWERSNQNPVEMLSKIRQEVLERAADDDGFVASLNRVYDRYKAYLAQRRWFQEKYPQYSGDKIAYFSLEYGLDTGLPVYSGGLGILSGDTLKSASDIGVPMVAIGLLYRYGYFRQMLSSDGWQQERYDENDWYQMPVELARTATGEPIRVTVHLEQQPVVLQVWRVNVGTVPLYLLDANIPENSTRAREITTVLYGGDKEMRIRQEIVLGIGGVRALKALGVEPSIYHINEGHAWFLTIERVKNLMRDHGLSYREALQFIWSTTIFTTHTPVPAGNERFEPVQVQRYLGDSVAELGVDWKEFLSLGRIFPDQENETFCMTVAALKTSAHCNGVSKLHGEVTRAMWHNIWPGVPKDEVPITSVTNGVHVQSWLSHDMAELFESYLGTGFAENPDGVSVWKKINKIPDLELWRVHGRRRERLVFFARKSVKQHLVRRGGTETKLVRADQILDPQILTIGFARRFSTYKRGQLLFSDPDRLERIINNSKCPVQVVIAGKAHPLDTPGKEIIKQISKVASEERFRNRIVFIEDYDINSARYLVQGCDVWLNNPRRPQEASGTSGMKAALNGVLNLSILDGWWCEGYTEETGFKIGSGEEYDNTDVQDQRDGEELYMTLENEVIPLFYDRNGSDYPARWVLKMKSSIRMAGEQFAAQQMLKNYAETFYVHALDTSARLRQQGFSSTRTATSWIDKMSRAWDRVQIQQLVVCTADSMLYVGQVVPVNVIVDLGELTPDDVVVEIVSGRLDSQDQMRPFVSESARLVQSANGHGAPSPNVFSFSSSVQCRESGRFGIRARVRPKHDLFPHTFVPKLISWS